MVCKGPRLYDAEKEVAVIELTEQQAQALKNPTSTPLRIVDPRTKETFVLLRVEEYDRRKEQEYDDSPWTREELQALAWERLKHEDWDEYDDLPEKS
jgi:alpha-D-ribose 1-methylphosphonate 5-phosphate C-P lyase